MFKLVRNENGSIIFVKIDDNNQGYLYINEETKEQIIMPAFEGNMSSATPSENEGNFAPAILASATATHNTESSNVIWVNRRSTELDIEAVNKFLDLYSSEKYQVLFRDRKTVNKDVWKEIGKEMVELGYNFGTSDINTIGEKCDQKWRNLEKSYVDFNSKPGKSGEIVEKQRTPLQQRIHEIIEAKKAPKPVTFSILVSSTPKTTTPVGSLPAVEVAGPSSSVSDSTSDVIWVNRRSTDLDLEAVNRFLDLYASEKYQKLFNDRKSIKKDLWREIGKEMAEEGFNFGTTDLKIIGEKCSQKWRNLEKSYADFNKALNTAVEEGREEVEKLWTPLKERLHELMGAKHASKMANIVGVSSTPSPNATSSSSVSESRLDIKRPLQEQSELPEWIEAVVAQGGPSVSEPEILVFESGRKRRKLLPSLNKISNEDILRLIKKCHEEMMAAQEKQFQVVKQYLEASSAQRERFLKLMDAFLSQQGNKK